MATQAFYLLIYYHTAGLEPFRQCSNINLGMQRISQSYENLLTLLDDFN